MIIIFQSYLSVETYQRVNDLNWNQEEILKKVAS